MIGAGPAGLAAAHDLALLGYAVTVFEAGDEPGGMMRFGIPEYRLPRTLIRAEIDKILALGVTLQLADAALAGLRPRRAPAAGLRGGLPRRSACRAAATSRSPGVELDGVVKAVDYLLNVNRGYRMDLGRRVVVIGGGFVAFDAARTALRVATEEEQEPPPLESDGDARVKEALDSARAALRGGATEVTIVSLESFDEMPVLRTHAGARGVRGGAPRGRPLRHPPRAHAASSATAVSRPSSCARVVSVFDDDGRFAPVYDDDDVDVARGRRLHPRDRPAARPLVPQAGRRRRARRPAARSASIPRRSPPPPPASSPAATSPSVRAT